MQKKKYLVVFFSDLFIIAILFFLSQYPRDDGSCASYSEIDCAKQRSALDDSQQSCYWDEASSVCKQKDHEMSMKVRAGYVTPPE